MRLGWLAQTALLVVQAARADGFPWATWAGSLNLFVWLVVGAYLIWGCRPRFRLLGLAVMPLAPCCSLVARVGGAARDGRPGSHYGRPLSRPPRRLRPRRVRGLHACAAALAGLYLWQERGSSAAAADVLRLGPAVARDARAADARAAMFVSLPLLTARPRRGSRAFAPHGGGSTR